MLGIKVLYYYIIFYQEFLCFCLGLFVGWFMWNKEFVFTLFNIARVPCVFAMELNLTIIGNTTIKGMYCSGKATVGNPNMG